MRINKYLALKGFATRRAADRLIEEGKVMINGKKALLGDKVHEGDAIAVRQNKRSYRYFAYNKPMGVITHSPQLGEKDIKSATSLRGIFPIGRLDKRSHGLIILTDDGRVTERLLNPDYVHEKEYRVTVRDPLPKDFKKRMERGVNIEGYMTRQCKVEIAGPKRFHITLTEGKKHQIRRMCAALGVEIDDLERVRIMNIKLGMLRSGDHRPIVKGELVEFKKQLGLLD